MTAISAVQLSLGLCWLGVLVLAVHSPCLCGRFYRVVFVLDVGEGEEFRFDRRHGLLPSCSPVYRRLPVPTLPSSFQSRNLLSAVGLVSYKTDGGTDFVAPDLALTATKICRSDSLSKACSALDGSFLTSRR